MKSQNATGGNDTTPWRPSEDQRWLKAAREDLDSNAEVWAVKPMDRSVSKAQAIGGYLDILLTDLGHPPKPHRCSVCGQRHEP